MRRPVTEEQSEGRGLVAARGLLSLRKFRYRLSSHIARVSEKWLWELLDSCDQFSLSAFGFPCSLVPPTCHYHSVAPILYPLVLCLSHLHCCIWGSLPPAQWPLALRTFLPSMHHGRRVTGIRAW